jgi:hypothetical protein
MRGPWRLETTALEGNIIELIGPLGVLWLLVRRLWDRREARQHGFEVSLRPMAAGAQTGVGKCE